MPTLNWIGKDAVINHHNDVKFRTLTKKYTFSSISNEQLAMSNSEKTQPIANCKLLTANSENKIIHGDNLEALKALLPEYEGRIKCIYIDPPYNTGASPENGGWIYYDNVDSPRMRRWLGQVVGKEAEDLTRHDKWLCMMYPRLKLLQKLLSDDGVIFISIDDNEQANLKLICDEIFGEKNMLLSIIVNRASEIATAYTIQKHEYCLCYAKDIENIGIDGNRKYTISRGTVGNENQTMPKIEFPKGLKCYGIPDGTYFVTRKIEGSNENVENFTPIIVKDEVLQNDIILKARWRSSNDMRNFFANNCQLTKAKINGYIEEIYFTNDRFVPQIKKLTTEKLSSIYRDNKRGSDTLKQMGLKYEFNYPKYVGFIEDLVKLFSTQDSIILDSFAGSGTTAHAVLNLNQQDGGHRKFILVEMEDYAETITAERVRRVMNGYGNGKNAVEGTGGSFTFYELGETVFDENGYLNETIGIQKIREYIWYSETREPIAVETCHGASLQYAPQHLLGNHNGTAYYFYYEPDQITTLDKAFLNNITHRAEQYVIYADNCLLSDEFMQLNHIIFKKIPRDIRKL
ncbi:MAG: site-specific DNA-methyltransferase [Bacteroidales bacterium]|nr:site-specific DNA-methyltransferase [Bacteroidales bacterium]